MKNVVIVSLSRNYFRVICERNKRALRLAKKALWAQV